MTLCAACLWLHVDVIKPYLALGFTAGAVLSYDYRSSMCWHHCCDSAPE